MDIVDNTDTNFIQALEATKQANVSDDSDKNEEPL